MVCPTFSSWNGSTCLCVSGYYPISGSCSQCPINTNWNGSACACLSGFYLSGGNCISCPQFSTYSSIEQKCICDSGYRVSETQCTSVCPTKSQWDGSKCACISGFYFIQNSCLPCDPNSIYSAASQTCLCKDGYFGTFSLCTACDSSCATCSGAGSLKCTSCRDGVLTATG